AELTPHGEALSWLPHRGGGGAGAELAPHGEVGRALREALLTGGARLTPHGEVGRALSLVPTGSSPHTEGGGAGAEPAPHGEVGQAELTPHGEAGSPRGGGAGAELAPHREVGQALSRLPTGRCAGEQRRGIPELEAPLPPASLAASCRVSLHHLRAPLARGYYIFPGNLTTESPPMESIPLWAARGTHQPEPSDGIHSFMGRAWNPSTREKELPAVEEHPVQPPGNVRSVMGFVRAAGRPSTQQVVNPCKLPGQWLWT
ncbi:hypothetical protein CYMTET_34696, partial [Cymbomonas tetramitiformis]